MAARLTTLSKLLFTLLIVGVIVGLFYLLKNNGVLSSIAPASKEDGDVKGIMSGKNPNGISGKSSDETIKVGVVTWGGYAGGQYFNEGFTASEQSRFYKDYGLKVEFNVLDDFDASRAAFKADEVNLLWATVDAFPTEVKGLADFEPQILFQADWSRGGDAIVARRGIDAVKDLKGKKIAVAPMTPSHTFLLWMLDAGDLEPKEVTIIEVPNAIDAATYFKSGKVDAAVVWSPDDADCVRNVPGAKILQSTKNASHIIADIFYAKKSYIQSHVPALQKLYEGWMKGAAEINASDVNKRKAARILSQGLNIPEEDAYKAINNTRLCTHGDNRNFFGLNSEYSGVKGEDLYDKMSLVYHRLNYAPASVPNWRLIANSSLVNSNTSLIGTEHSAESAKTFSPTGAAQKASEAIATKRLRINFRTAEYLLDENAKYIIDKDFGDIAKAFANSRIRIEGNTDNVGDYTANKNLSLRRAQSVADYLSAQYNFSKNRFVIIGNGPDNPVSDNNTDEGRAKNRRTDFELIAD